MKDHSGEEPSLDRSTVCNAGRWPVVELGDVCEVQLGKMLSPKSKTGVRPVPYLRNENVQWNRFKLDDVAWMDFTETEEAKFRLKPGDLLVCEGGEPGRAAIWEGQIERCCYQKALHRIRPRKGQIHPPYLMYRLWMSVLLSEFAEAQTQTTISHLPREKLVQLLIPLPPLSQQQRIATGLTEAMATVDKARRAALERLAAAESLPGAYLREVFEGPEVIGTRVQLSDAATVVMGQSPPGSSYNREQRGEPLLNGPSEFGPRHPLAVQWTTEPTRFCEPDDILFCVRGATTGRKVIADRRYCIGRGLAAIRGIDGRATTGYLWYLLDWIRDGMLKRAAGSTFVNLPGRELEEFEVALPDPSTQRRLASDLSRRVEATELLIRRCREEIASIDALPAALLRRAFQGEPS